jgi:N-acetylmuramoyl-L-alanine amidase
MALNRVAIPTTTYSSRGGSGVTTVVIHSSEGAQSYQDLGAFFQRSANTSNPTSSHVGIDNKAAGTIGEYVPRSGKAWTAANANPWSVQAELCTPNGASNGWSTADWTSKTVMMANLAAWVGEECAYFGIPLVALTAAQAQNPSVKGVCQHIDLGSMGGGHVDCGGSRFPLQTVLDMAKGGAAPLPPQPQPEEETLMMIIQRTATGGAAIYDGCYKTVITESSSMAAFQAAGLKVAVISAAMFDSIPYRPNAS